MKLNPMRKGRKKMLRKKRMRKNPRQKQLEKTTYEWEFLNDVKAIWLRNPKDLIEEEYEKFYCSLVKVLSISCLIGSLECCGLLVIMLEHLYYLMNLSYFYRLNFSDEKPLHGVTSLRKVTLNSRP